MDHAHDIYNDSIILTIDPSTRSIKTEEKELKVVQYEHNSQRYIFKLPRMIQGHDMSLCNLIQIHYDNISKDKTQINHDFYTVDDMRISSDDDMVVMFSWPIRRGATQIVGKLSFSIYFACITETGETEYVWDTMPFDKVIVYTTIYNNESLVIEYSDFVERMEALASSIKYDSGQIQHQTIEFEESVQNSMSEFEESVQNSMKEFALQVSDEHISALINEALGVIENGTY